MANGSLRKTSHNRRKKGKKNGRVISKVRRKVEFIEKEEELNEISWSRNERK